MGKTLTEQLQDVQAGKGRATKLYDAAAVALLAGKHVPEAIRVMAGLLKCKRPSVQLAAATKLIELATEAEPDRGGGSTKVYVLATGSDRGAVAAELRRRLAPPPA
jgi:hypothetical protein